MKFNKLIPELTVSDINRTKEFYINILGFKLEFERIEDKFIFLSFEGSQIMFEQFHNDGWNIADMQYPYGRGVNFEIEVNNIDELYSKIFKNNIKLYRKLKTNFYIVNGKKEKQKEFLIMDPDGYLLRFIN